MKPFADRLHDAIAAKGTAACVGLDPVPEQIPHELSGLPLARVERFCRDVLDIVAPHVAVVKPQIGYFEALGPDGYRLYFDVVRHARSLGLLTIGDIKRGDIGSTSAAYAEAHLAADDAPDAVTINPMLGLETIRPFIDAAERLGKGVFALVRTSNPDSARLQDAKLADGRSWSEMLADELAAISPPPGESGFCSVGAVVGATQPHVLASLRRRLPRATFLLPGYGTQGGTADMTRHAFINGRGALISASRSVLYPPPTHDDWRADIAAAVRRLTDGLSTR